MLPMQVISCPWCNSRLPNAMSTHVCTACGKTLHSVTPTTSTMAESAETSELDPEVAPNTLHLETPSHLRSVLFFFSHFSLLRKGFLLPRWWNYRPRKRVSGLFAERMAFSIPLTLDLLEDDKPF